MKAMLIGLWRRLPPRARAVLAAIGAAVAAAFALFFVGKRAGRAGGEASGAADERIRQLKDAGARGDDEAVDRAIKDSVKRRRKRR